MTDTAFDQLHSNRTWFNERWSRSTSALKFVTVF